MLEFEWADFCKWQWAILNPLCSAIGPTLGMCSKPYNANNMFCSLHDSLGQKGLKADKGILSLETLPISVQVLGFIVSDAIRQCRGCPEQGQNIVVQTADSQVAHLKMNCGGHLCIKAGVLLNA